VRQFDPSVRNPRGGFEPPALPVDLRPPEELKAGVKLPGVVTNIADFGAFVDIGADQDGLVHISQLGNEFVRDPKAAVQVGQQVEVYILALEEGGKRISLSMRDPSQAARRTRPPVQKPGDQRGKPEGRRRRREPQRERGAVRRTFGPEERSKAREEEEYKKLTLEEKLALLENKFKTKV
jgi:uncharacterized protein